MCSARVLDAVQRGYCALQRLVGHVLLLGGISRMERTATTKDGALTSCGSNFVLVGDGCNRRQQGLVSPE